MHLKFLFVLQRLKEKAAEFHCCSATHLLWCFAKLGF